MFSANFAATLIEQCKTLDTIKGVTVTESNEGDFSKFLGDLETSELEHMATAHHSAVNVREWAESTKPETNG